MPILTDIQLDIALQKLTEAGEKLYLLLEGAGNNAPARERLLAHDNRQPYVPLYIDTDYEPVVGASPLLALVEPGDAILEWYLKRGPDARGIILAAPHKLEIVFQHLRGMIEVRMPDYNYAAFRYHDPKVIECYLNSVDNEGMQRFLGPLSFIAWPRRTYEKGTLEHWIWRALLATERLPDEHNPYLHPQPVIEITDEQLTRLKKERYESMAHMLGVNGALNTRP